MNRCLRALFVTLSVVLFATFGWTSLATAGDSLTGVLGGTEWGASPLKVCKNLEAKVEAEAKAEMNKLSDPAKQDRVRAEMERELERLRKSLYTLKNRKKFGATIVRDEFLEANGESLMLIKDANSTMYYFFLGGELYKVAVSYAPKSLGEMEFVEFVGIVSDKYGKDFDQNFDDDGFLDHVVWEKSGSRLRVEDETPTYDTFLMVFTDAGREDNVASKHASAKAERKSDPGVSAAIDAATEGTDDIGERAADSIIGRVEVNLAAGIPEDERIPENGEGFEATGATEDKSGISKKKRKRSARRKKGQKKIDAKEFEKRKTEGTALIVY